MKKFFIVETSTQYEGTIEYKPFETEEEAINYIKEKFLTRLKSEEAVNEMTHRFRGQYEKDFTLMEIYYDHELFTWDNVCIDDYGRIEYKTQYEQYTYNHKHDSLPYMVSEALTNQGKSYTESYYAINEDGKYYNGRKYFDSLEEMKEAVYKAKSRRYA